MNTKLKENISLELINSKAVKKIKEFLSSCNDINMVFLFGSFAKGNEKPLSDIDIAVFFNIIPDYHRVSSLKEKLSAILNKEIDIVVLNNASPIIRMQALKNGTLLISKNSKNYNEFFVKTVLEYDDLKQIRKEIEDNILKGKIYA